MDYGRILSAGTVRRRLDRNECSVLRDSGRSQGHLGKQEASTGLRAGTRCTHIQSRTLPRACGHRPALRRRGRAPPSFRSPRRLRGPTCWPVSSRARRRREGRHRRSVGRPRRKLSRQLRSGPQGRSLYPTWQRRRLGQGGG